MPGEFEKIREFLRSAIETDLQKVRQAETTAKPVDQVAHAARAVMAEDTLAFLDNYELGAGQPPVETLTLKYRLVSGKEGSINIDDVAETMEEVGTLGEMLRACIWGDGS